LTQVLAQSVRLSHTGRLCQWVTFSVCTIAGMSDAGLSPRGVRSGLSPPVSSELFKVVSVSALLRASVQDPEQGVSLLIPYGMG